MKRFTYPAALGAALAVSGLLCSGRPTAAAGAVPDRLLVLSKTEGMLAIIDPETLAVLGKVPTGESPHEVIAAPDGKLAYVANYGGATQGRTLSVIDLEAKKELRRVDLGALRRPHGLAEFGGKIYFTAEVNCVLARYDPAADKVDWLTGTGKLGSHMVTVSPEGDRLYTTDIGSDSVTEITPAAGGASPQVATFPVGPRPEGMALSADGAELWVGHVVGGQITVLDTETGQVRERLSTGGVPIRLQFTPDGKRVLVSDAQTGTVRVYEAASRKELKQIPVGKTPVGLVVTPDGKRAFVSVAGEDRVQELDLEALTVKRTVDAGPGPDGIAWASPRLVREPRKRGVLGVAIAPLTEDARKALGIEAGGGVLVQGAGAGSPAQAADLRPGDVIISVNGKPIAGVAQFLRVVGRTPAGEALTMEIIRNSRPFRKRATLAEAGEH